MKYTSRFVLALLFLAGMSTQPCRAELSEAQIESAYIFNFIKFVEWPDSAVKSGGNIRLCIMGNDELQTLLATLNGRDVGEYRLQVVPSGDGMEHIGTCHVLYIDQQETRRFVPILKSLGERPVLTISDIPNFAERGGNIGLVYRENRVLFEINLASARIAGLRLSSQMLNLAANIFGK
jgi:hypothetical protein